MRSRTPSLLLLALVLIVASVATAIAAPAHKRASSRKAPAQAAKPAASVAPVAVAASVAHAPVVSGLRAFIDPETGLITSTIIPLEAPSDLATTNLGPEDLVPVTLPNGSIMVNLQGLFEDQYVLSLDPLGRRVVTCGQHVHKLAKAPLLETVPAPVER